VDDAVTRIIITLAILAAYWRWEAILLLDRESSSDQTRNSFWRSPKRVVERLQKRDSRELTEGDLKDSLSIRHGHIRDVKVSLYAVVRDEMFFMPAFFDHYRRLGVQQFIVLDDGSSDGTSEFLEGQPDCAVLSTQFSYGQMLSLRSADGRLTRDRAGVFLRRAIPKKYLLGKYVVYADADEFLILPPEVGSLSVLIDQLASSRIDCVAASLIDFFPRTVAGLNSKTAPSSFAALVAAYPCFDALTLLDLQSGRQPHQVNISASGRLFAQYGVKQAPPFLSWLPGWVVDALPFPVPRTACMKTPIVRWTENVWLKSSHKANVAPPSDILLAMAHFKFTWDLARRVAAAMQRKSHYRGSQKYFQYHRLLKRLSAGSRSFVGPATRVYQDPESFEGTGLMKWHFSLTPNGHAY
jgi:hypothetical protein